MSSPRVFISSTYYDLKYVREELHDFIISLGYDPVMHDRGSVAYSQKESLEQSCYTEISNCDIIVCIIGNRYGTKSSESDYSITMEELQHALKDKKKIYVYILNEVYTENITYLKNKDLPDVKYAFADDVKIHKFIAEIKERLSNTPIVPFSNVSDITSNLKTQFAGLFQLLLRKDAATTEMTTYNDLEEVVVKLKNIVEEFNESKTELFKGFDASVVAINPLSKILRQNLGIEKFGVYLKDLKSVDEFLETLGFEKVQDDGFSDYIYNKSDNWNVETIEIERNLFDEKNGYAINTALPTEMIKNKVRKTVKSYQSNDSINTGFPEDIPF